ncbi:helix-turn-helix domain-containing protein [Pseudonocardia sp. DSM 110487]|uniref:helix-turn-helix domain-containing protein n=1 Tax=Pseudonocardia sp. DSM 110487 TaxID=2865833 RepID=UPI001C6997D9|nr:helix-turn-helix domain-containing protein [Pseudonocardia sp. DSM 110487]QYN39630.1 helix-turn-helix domain-containing protein [Pseudonocardia sp. DSM 110487]
MDGEYSLGRPHPALAGCVVRYLGYREHSTTPVRRRQAPGASCTLILGLGPPIRLHGPAGPSVPASFLAGMHDGPVLTEFTGHQYGLQVDLSPLGVFALLGRSMAELTNVSPQLTELDVPELAGLPARLAEEPGWPRRFALLDDVLLGRLDASTIRPDPQVAWAWRRLRRSAGRVGVRELADDTGWSRRHLLTRFRAQVGLGPKTAARVLRFHHAARLLAPASVYGAATPAAPSISDVAAACGYADHAHLVREFHALAGCTPTEYLDGWS